MNRLFVVLVVISLSASLLAVANSGALTQESDKRPLMVAFADLKWTKLAEEKA